jgi:hypothetical protein
MPATRTLLIGLVVGLAVFVLAAFTVFGLVGELVVALSLLGLAARGACALTARLRHVESC